MNPRLIMPSRSPVHGFFASSAAIVSFSRCAAGVDGFASVAA
jgi:hypothetical protein